MTKKDYFLTPLFIGYSLHYVNFQNYILNCTGVLISP